MPDRAEGSMAGAGAGPSPVRTVVLSAALSGVTVIAVIVALIGAWEASDEPLYVQTFDDFFLAVFLIGLVEGLALACFRRTRWVGVGVILGVLGGCAGLTAYFFFSAAASGGLS